MVLVVLFSLFLVDAEQLNSEFWTRRILRIDLDCSVEDPCKNGGDCRENEQGQWMCQCKFWWNGTRCDQMTNSGKQVIFLACLFGCLLILSIGLTIIRAIQKKRNQPKEINRK